MIELFPFRPKMKKVIGSWLTRRKTSVLPICWLRQTSTFLIWWHWWLSTKRIWRRRNRKGVERRGMTRQRYAYTLFDDAFCFWIRKKLWYRIFGVICTLFYICILICTISLQWIFSTIYNEFRIGEADYKG